tara:strand:+ start:3471 stop:3677 length:207 start_codon:yes stop_codon:yes gene_type:complete
MDYLEKNVNHARKEKRMVMFDIAEWIANLLVLGVAIVMWSIGLFIVAMLMTMAKQWIDNLKEEGVKEQ